MIGTSCSCVDICAIPLNNCMVPSVIRNEGTRKPTIRRPLSRPAPMPVSSPNAIPAGRPKWRRPSAVKRADMATTEPIDRSISPAVRTNTAP